MIEIKNLSFAIGGIEVLRDFSCSIGANEITAIVGRNGVGKSTLLSLIAGDERQFDGDISIKGRHISDFSHANLAKLRSVAQQSHHYWMAYSTREILLLGNEETSKDRFTSIVEALSLQDFLDQSVTTLSGGQLQRIEIARAFMRDVELVLLDEPFASQDLASISKMKEFFTSEKASGKTIVVVAHARLEELDWCDKVIEIEAR